MYGWLGEAGVVQRRGTGRVHSLFQTRAYFHAAFTYSLGTSRLFDLNVQNQKSGLAATATLGGYVV